MTVSNIVCSWNELPTHVTKSKSTWADTWGAAIDMMQEWEVECRNPR